jgi:hypothetical protein
METLKRNQSLYFRCKWNTISIAYLKSPIGEAESWKEEVQKAWKNRTNPLAIIQSITARGI